MEVDCIRSLLENTDQYQGYLELLDIPDQYEKNDKASRPFVWNW